MPKGKEQLGEDEATKKMVEEFKAENDKAKEQIEQEKKDEKLAKDLQDEEIKKAKVDKLFGEGAYEESKKVQAKKEQFEKVFGEGTYIPYKEEQAKKEKIEKLFGEGAYEESKKIQAEKEKFEKVFGKGSYAEYKSKKDVDKSQKKTIDANPFIKAVSDLLDTGEEIPGAEYQDVQKELNAFVNSAKGASAEGKRMPVMKDKFLEGFQRLTDKANKLQAKLALKAKLEPADWHALATAGNIHTLSSMANKGITPDSKEGVKMMLATKIAHGGSLSFTDGKEFACNSEKFMKTVENICKSPSFAAFTKGKSMEELNNLMEMDDNKIFKGFTKQMEMTKTRQMEAAKKKKEEPKLKKEPPKKEKKNSAGMSM